MIVHRKRDLKRRAGRGEQKSGYLEVKKIEKRKTRYETTTVLFRAINSGGAILGEIKFRNGREKAPQRLHLRRRRLSSFA